MADSAGRRSACGTWVFLWASQTLQSPPDGWPQDSSHLAPETHPAVAQDPTRGTCDNGSPPRGWFTTHAVSPQPQPPPLPVLAQEHTSWRVSAICSAWGCQSNGVSPTTHHTQDSKSLRCTGVLHSQLTWRPWSFCSASNCALQQEVI